MPKPPNPAWGQPSKNPWGPKGKPRKPTVGNPAWKTPDPKTAAKARKRAQTPKEFRQAIVKRERFGILWAHDDPEDGTKSQHCTRCGEEVHYNHRDGKWHHPSGRRCTGWTKQ